MRALDQWMRKGLHHARKKRTPEWEDAYDEASSKRFLIYDARSKVPNVLAGVLAPSRDERERTYPFMVTCEIPKHALSKRHFAYLPVQAESFFHSAGTLVRRAKDGKIGHRELSTQIDDMEATVAVKPTVPHRHKRYLKQERIGSFLQALFGEFESNKKYQLFSTLFEALRPLRGRRPSLDYGLKFPLPANEDVRTNAVAFWMGVVLRVLDYPSVVPTLFWTDSQSESDAPELLLYLGVPDPEAFYDLFGSTHNGHVRALSPSEDQSSAEAALSIPSEYGELLEDQHLSLWDFLRKL